MQAFVPKNRKPKFELVLKIHDLNNVPLVSGTSYVKWHLPHSTAPEHKGKTEKAQIKDHKVVWEYEKNLTVRITTDKNGILRDADITFQIYQEYAHGAKSERITLGELTLNLAEYVDEAFDEPDGITRRYLMQQSKINSTIKISVLMNLLEGDHNFTAPPLKSGSTFGGIAGLMHGEGDHDDGYASRGKTQNTKDRGEMQDMYRQTLTASYVSHVHELRADECIEDIFKGGDGWGSGKEGLLAPYHHSDDDDEPSDHGVRPRRHRRKSSSQTLRQSHYRKKSHGRSGGHQRDPFGSGKSSDYNDSQGTSSSADDFALGHHRSSQEISEFDLRDDLRSWTISDT